MSMSSVAWAASWPVSSETRLASRLHTRLALTLEAEQGRWFLWIPVFFGAGVGLYFASRVEPSPALAAGAFAAALGLRIVFQHTLLAFLATSILLTVAAGFLVAVIRTAVMAAPVLERRGAYDLTGFVETFERQANNRYRAVIRLRSLAIDNAEVGKRPFRARISVRSQTPIEPGAFVKLRALLQPPPEPARPGGFDFARLSFYQGVGASGFSLSRIEVADPGSEALPFDMQVRTWLAGVRGKIGDRIREALPGKTGEIAAALTVGQTAGLDDKDMDALRKSGLAHVISISGLHMSLVAGTVFWFLRWFLCFFPSIALRYSTRTLAGVAALICVTVYLALSGAAIGAVRSYIMIAVVFAAILLNRPALSLRNVAVSGILILIVLPDSLFDVSFQMSFAATAALIAGYETFGKYLHFEAKSVRERLIWQPVYFVGAVLLTTATAGMAVEPFSAYHFHNLTTYAALGNLLGGPPVDFLTMPAMIVALLAMPFGAEGWPLAVMGFGIEVMMQVAYMVGSLPNAVVNVPAFPFAALLAIILGGLWLLIWQTRWRFFGLVGIGAGLALTTWRDVPDVYVDREAKVIAVRNRDGLLTAPKAKKPAYAIAQWLKADGDGRESKDAITGAGFRCDAASCLTLVKGKLISLVKKPDALQDDCQRVHILIAPMDIRVPCPSPELILDRGALWEKGAVAIAFTEAGTKVWAASDYRGVRPWARDRKRREPIPAAIMDPDRPREDEFPEFRPDGDTG